MNSPKVELVLEEKMDSIMELLEKRWRINVNGYTPSLPLSGYDISGIFEIMVTKAVLESASGH